MRQTRMYYFRNLWGNQVDLKCSVKSLSIRPNLSISYTNFVCVAQWSQMTVWPNERRSLLDNRTQRSTLNWQVRPSFRYDHKRKLSICISQQKRDYNDETTIMVEKEDNEIIFQGSNTKKMKIDVDGESNKIIFTFE